MFLLKWLLPAMCVKACILHMIVPYYSKFTHLCVSSRDWQSFWLPFLIPWEYEPLACVVQYPLEARLYLFQAVR